MSADLLSRSHATEGLSVLLLIHGPIGRLQTQVGTTDPATRGAGRSCMSGQYGSKAVMSLVVVQIGQCGNQIGQQLFEVVSMDGQSGRNESYWNTSQERFFSSSNDGVPVARAVLVDMEPKVISHTVSKAASSGRWRYGAQSAFCQKQGSGNNWANGFCVHGPQHEEAVMDLVQQEAEKCERLSGFVTMMSLAGGTGSGLGTFVTQCLRDRYPHSLIMNQLTWPYGTGEIIVQNYNTMLTLSHLYQSSDALLIQENDIIHKICSQLMNIKQISFTDINKVIAHQLASVLQPAYTRNHGTEYGSNPLGDLLESLVTHPEYKLLGLMNIPQMSDTSLQFSTFAWPGLLKHLRQMLMANTKMEAGLFKEQALYTSWMPVDSAFNIWRTPTSFNKYEKSATLVSNSQCLLKPLDSAVKKAWDMFASRAYVHQYTKHGISEEEFLDSFTTMEQVIASYSNLGLQS
ncbi:tubulin delta chain isoform X2 [Amblyraja radiata]|uniref:tubulin delta chain isoform X2 n=1 Tax=Amblyraja radiata TaxID=386614 RepID=UPI00140333E2|nr:tubulin delta chain isoform X2 [Amblyraja radiata]